MFRAPTAGSRPLRRAIRSSFLILAVTLLVAGCLPEGFAERTTQQALVLPTSMAFANDGRLFVTEKRGTIQTYDSVDDTTPQLVADLRDQVQNTQDHGLLAIEVDHQWPTRPYVYILYTYDAPPGGTAPTYSNGTDTDPCFLGACPSQGRIARLTIGTDARMTDLEVLTKDVCFPSFLHGGGGLRQAADGSLIAAFGDGAFDTPDGYFGAPDSSCQDPPGEGGNLVSQDLRTWGDPTTLAGSIIRIDPDTGEAWRTNPGLWLSDREARKIIGFGTRNPYRLAVRPGTSEVWIADVGSAYTEEINRIVPGPLPNFGWPCFEGAARTPEVDALHVPLCDSLTPDAQTPPYYSYCHNDPVAPPPCGFGEAAISGLELYTGDAYGERYRNALFFADYTRNTIWAMLATDGIPDPTRVEEFATDVGAAVDLRTGPNGDLFYVDIFNGRIQRLYQGDPPPADTTKPAAVIDEPEPGTTYTVGQQLPFSGHGFDAAGNPLPDSALRWDLIVLHCPTQVSCHRHFADSRSGVAAGSFTAVDHERPSKLEIALTVTADGRTDTTTVVLEPSVATLGPVAAPPVAAPPVERPSRFLR